MIYRLNEKTVFDTMCIASYSAASASLPGLSGSHLLSPRAPLPAPPDPSEVLLTAPTYTTTDEVIASMDEARDERRPAPLSSAGPEATPAAMAPTTHTVPAADSPQPRRAARRVDAGNTALLIGIIVGLIGAVSVLIGIPVFLLNEEVNRLSDRVESLDDKVDARFDAQDDEINERFLAQDAKIDQGFLAQDAKIDQGFLAQNDKMDRRFEAQDAKIDQGFLALNDKMDRAFEAQNNRIDRAFEAQTNRIDRASEAQNNSIDRRFEALEARMDARFATQDVKIEDLRRGQSQISEQLAVLIATLGQTATPVAAEGDQAG